MKHILLILVFLFAVSSTALAKGIVPYCTGCEYITIVGDLPDEEKFFEEKYQGYLEIGYIYTQIWLAWIPLWNSNGRYCFTIRDQEVYFDITDEELQKLSAEYKIELPTNPIPFWDKIGGKLLVALAALILLLSRLRSFFKE